ncbi:heparan sulfate 2-O-sulfotransferase pipe isoform X3 [Cydia pomonella]|uniref:heparan sulfate 2-O-sulfotransferase pipe isoform X3 n=1 Tax=Cydia pomonella TaxID=82600 RepID=UPI002ADDA59A|nr:heparan sulfate 2-O-sulfotransferase pipe isoform X3 [Cydia pomonella]
MDHLFRQRRISVPKRTSELVALIAVSCTLFLFLHTRDLSTKLRRMEGRLNDDVTAFNHLTDSKCYSTSELVALIAVSCTLFLFLHTRDLSTKLRRMEGRLNDDVTAFNHLTDSKCYSTSELVALIAVSCTLFLFLHTRDLSTKLRRMEGRLNDDVTAFNHLTDSKCYSTSELVALIAVSCTLFLFLHTRDLSTKLRRMEGRLNDDVTAFNHLTDSKCYSTSELVALIAVSCTLFLFLHTRDLSTKLRRMEGRLNDDVTAFNHLTDSKCYSTSELVALIAVSCTLFLFLHTRDLSTKLRRMEGRLNDDVTAFNHLTDSKCYSTSELVALIAVSCTLFLFLHTRDLSTKLRRMEGRLNDDVTAFNHLTDRIETGLAGYASAQEHKEALEAIRRHTGAERKKPQRTLEAEPEDAQEEMEQYLEEIVPEPWELNNTARAGMELLFFNRVPKVGSQTFMELLRRLAARNQFGFHRDAVQRVETIRLAPADQQVLASIVTAHAPPASYIKHVCYTNFTRYGYPSPIYVNVVRDPVERVISWYYYVRAPWYYVERKRAFPDLPLPDPAWLKKDFETCVLSGDRECRYVQGETHEGIGDHRRQTLFFCGHEPQCTPFNSVEALQRAKRVVEEQYAVVGVLEDMNSTLLAFERYIPRFFSGASKLYWEELNTFNRINRNAFKPPVSEAVKNMVRANFTREIEFYEFCKQRLHLQLKALREPGVTLPVSQRVKRRAVKRFRRV